MQNLNSLQSNRKVVVIGDSGVGKTTVIKKLMSGQFIELLPTVGVEYNLYEARINQGIIKLNVWDTAGQEKYQAVVKGFFRNAFGAILMYSIDNKISFTRTSKWLDDFRQLALPDAPVILVGNKNDLDESRAVTVEEGAAYACKLGMDFFETSAKTGENIEEVFRKLAQLIENQIETYEASLETDQNEVELQPKDKKSCCNQQH
ncbi:Ras family protein [Histomonas meleagridis]|uniref:Ras family protein n=1 Tax=Histomonas meleagridis TaxID=135588 RepID=UPI003559AE0E|nr:Ras family protein [Histomonas meleagridis]KAH0799806.1 Ras family protein [Histomonas meleagridis]